MKQIMHIPLQPEGSGYMSFDVQEALAIKQDAAKLAQAVKKEAKMQRAVRALIGQTLPDSDSDSKAVDVVCNNCQVKLEGGPQPRCARCKAVPYCSRDCQASDWTEHKKSCEKQNFILKVRLWRCNIAVARGLTSSPRYLVPETSSKILMACMPQTPTAHCQYHTSLHLKSSIALSRLLSATLVRVHGTS
jgi:hypothetical protein